MSQQTSHESITSFSPDDLILPLCETFSAAAKEYFNLELKLVTSKLMMMIIILDYNFPTGANLTRKKGSIDLYLKSADCVC